MASFKLWKKNHLYKDRKWPHPSAFIGPCLRQKVRELCNCCSSAQVLIFQAFRTLSPTTQFLFTYGSQKFLEHIKAFMCAYSGMRKRVLHKQNLTCHKGVGSGEMSEEPGLMDTLTISFFIHLSVWNITKTIGVGVNSNFVAVVYSKCMSDGK